MSVYAPTLIILWKTIESYGIDPKPLFAAEGIKVQLPIDPSVRVSYEKIDRIRAKAAGLCGDEAFGIRSASVYVSSRAICENHTGAVHGPLHDRPHLHWYLPLRISPI